MRLSAVLEATERRDKAKRRLARELFNALIRMIGPDAQKDLPLNKDYAGNIGGKKETIGIMLNPEDVPAPVRVWMREGNLDLLAIVLMPKGHSSRSGALRRLDAKGHMIEINCLDGNDVRKYPLGEYPARKVIESLGAAQWVFIHEVIHFIDDLTDKLLSKNPNKPGWSDEDYFNSPAEFNAYYQELISMIEKVMTDKVGVFDDPVENQEMAHHFSIFYRKIIGGLKSQNEFLANMTPQTERRFRKRLYNFYKETAVPLLMA